MGLKPDKGKEIVFVNSLDHLKSSKKIQHYTFLNNLKILECTRIEGETTKDENKQRRPKFAQISTAHGQVPSFRPIVDTTNTLRSR